MSADHQTRIIILERDEHLETTVRRFEKGWSVRFMRGASLLGAQVHVMTTLTGFSPLEWTSGLDHLAVYCELKCVQAGSFEYKFTVDKQSSACGSGYFIVMPQLSCNGKLRSLDAISCITHLTKLLGPLSSWDSKLRVAHESGYNMLHLTPIHQLGISNSSYSLADHHSLCKEMQTNSFDDVATVINRLETDWDMLTVQDVVWNHAAKNAKWLQDHPESAYNCLNSPHLRPAYVLDRVYHHFGKEISEGKWESRGVPKVVDNVHIANTIEYILRTEVLPKIRLHEFFQVDVEKTIAEFEEKARGAPSADSATSSLKIQQDPEWKRYGSRIDMHEARNKYNKFRHDFLNEDERVAKCSADFRSEVEYLNSEAGKIAWDILMSGLNAVMGGITYERIAEDGPKLGVVGEKTPLTTDYFLHLEPVSSWEKEEFLAFDEGKSAHLMAFNGWVMCSNPLKNFALPDSQVYLRRQLVCWGDSVKLNYGEKPDETSFLWNYMKEYTQKCASIFHGLRIDNAHGTPIHVAEFLLRKAREIRPDLYVFAELFTGSEELDNMFVNRLGISSLIREAQSAHDSHEQGRLVYRYGGEYVGAMHQRDTRLSVATIAHGLFLDQSHDNPTPIETRCIFDLLPTAAMLSMASCAVGSTRGYDELVRHAINVVHESRCYPSWEDGKTAYLGIIKGRKILNELHAELAENGFTQVFVDQMSPDVVAVTRHNPISHSTVILIVHTAFTNNSVNTGQLHLKRIPVDGVFDSLLFEMFLEQTSVDVNPESSSVLSGLSNYNLVCKQKIAKEEAKMVKIHENEIEITELTKGAVVAFRINLNSAQQKAVDEIHEFVGQKNVKFAEALSTSLSSLSLLDFNNLLFSCEEEDLAKIQQGSYEVPNYGKFVYCGLQGVLSVLDEIRTNNDLGHPLCQNLRDGNWLPQWVLSRMNKYKGLQELSTVFASLVDLLSFVPYYLRPSYFEMIVSFLYRKSREALLTKMNPSLHHSTSLVRSLTVSSVSFLGSVPGAGLVPIKGKKAEEILSVAAGFPHFSVEIWRNWGRDTFIALPGCLLETGRYEDAKNIILSFAGSLRHGLIPNLLAEGKGARYNCRDAVWFWLNSIVKYVTKVPNGEEILANQVKRIYPNDDTEYGKEYKEEALFDTMFEALQCHFKGISYRERNAGKQIDEHMKDEGFNISVFVDRNTGFIHGGNQFNCGTWMDKMGSSEKAGNRGFPATPRDGAAVEIQGLALSLVSALSKWNKNGIINKEGVSDGSVSWFWSDWEKRIRDNFESNFFVAEESQDKYANKRNILKDTYGSTAEFTDFQLRCNYPIAIAAEPTICDPHKAWAALNSAKALLGPLGIKTLDASDWAYNGFYNNQDGDDKKTACGWNYHQGPEWLWVAAYYLQARLSIGRILGGEYRNEAIQEIQSRLGAYYTHLQKSAWRSLPELTQEGGSVCSDSCLAQAWSVGCIIEVCQKLKDI